MTFRRRHLGPHRRRDDITGPRLRQWFAGVPPHQRTAAKPGDHVLSNRPGPGQLRCLGTCENVEEERTLPGRGQGVE